MEQKQAGKSEFGTPKNDGSKPASMNGGHAPLAAFRDHEEAQGFVIEMRTAALRGAPKDNPALLGKIYALFDAASAGFYLHDNMEDPSDD